MASLNNEELLITFEELTQLETADIAACIELYQALKICGKSSAPAEDVYNLWVRKLFKAYETSEYTNENWIEIIGFLEKLLDNVSIENKTIFICAFEVGAKFKELFLGIVQASLLLQIEYIYIHVYCNNKYLFRHQF